MNDPQNWNLLARYLAKEHNSSDEQEIESWLASDEENQKLLELLQYSFDLAEVNNNPSDLKLLWKKLRSEADISNDRNINYKQSFISKFKNLIVPRPIVAVWRYAAAALFLLFVPVILYQVGVFDQTQKYVSLTVANGTVERVTLDDGSVVTLDAGSYFEYPEKFHDDMREVILKGEGYFEVVANPEKPFIVQAKHGRIEVMGTKFNVLAWYNTRTVTVVVEEGQVGFSNSLISNDSMVIIRGGQQSVVDEKSAPSIPADISVAHYLSWMRDEIYFENAEFAEIINRLENWYNVQVSLENSELLREHITIGIPKSSLQDAVELLSRLMGVSYKIQNDKILFK